jgi:hypothetical protein
LRRKDRSFAGGAGRGDDCGAKAQFEKRVENTHEHIVIRVQTPDKYEFIDAYRDAVLEVFMLLFERRELDLGETQLYALHLLARSAKSLAVYRDPASKRSDKHGK